MGTKIEMYDLHKKVKDPIQSVATIETAKEKKLPLVLSDIENKVSGLSTSVLNISDDETRDELYTYDTTYPDNIIKEEVKLPDGTIARTVDYTYSNAEEGVIGGSVKKYKNDKGEQVTVTKTYSYNAAGSITKVATVKTVTPLIV